MVNESDKLKLLKELLLTDDTTFANRISERINHLENHLNDNDRLSKNVKPIIEEELEHFVKEMPKTLGPTITKTLKAEIKNSKDEVVEALFPILGKMIKKYVAHEMELLKESINSKTKSIFSFASFKRKAKSKITGISEEDLIVSELANPKIEEVFVIEKGSGIVEGHYSINQHIDKDMVSGMITAIKSFVEDAFSGKAENLEAISYELYTIHIQNFHKKYIAVVVSGSYTIMYREVLEDKLLDFYEALSKNKADKTCDNILEEFLKMSSAKKIVILGQFGVGKTSLTRRFVDQAFSEDYLVTLGVQIKKKTLTLKNGDELSLIIWDIEGTRSVKDTRASYLLGSQAIIYVFDVTRIETYENLAEEIEILKQHNIPIKVLANKSDLADIKSVLKYVKEHNLDINYFTSAKSGKNVDKAFNELANELGL